VHELVIIETGHIHARFKHEVCLDDIQTTGIYDSWVNLIRNQ